jgi:hypothetical protein
LSVSADGRYDKAANLEAVKHIRVAELKTRDDEARRMRRDAAILAYIYDCKVLSPRG